MGYKDITKDAKDPMQREKHSLIRFELAKCYAEGGDLNERFDDLAEEYNLNVAYLKQQHQHEMIKEFLRNCKVDVLPLVNGAT